MVDNMKKRFKAKKKIRLFTLFMFIIIMIITIVSFKIVIKIDPIFLLKQDYHFFTLDFNRNDYLLKNGFKIIEDVIDGNDIPVFDEVKTTSPIIRKKIYIYNTHQSEKYADFDVLNAALNLKNILADFNIEAIVEETNITEEVKKNNYTYSQSYRVTKSLMTNYLNKDISLFIDLHRDSSAKNITTTTVDGVNFAKMMFVVGGKHESYMENYRVSDAINKILKNNNNQISRGLLLRKSSSYNQELDPNVVLIELGGPENTKEEVLNTLHVLAKSIYEYLEE
jgi:stage II sporulation protein P